MGTAPTVELNHNEGISFTLVFKVHDDVVLSDGHKSQIVLALVYNKKPTVMKLARALVSPGRYPVPLQVAQPDSASRSAHSSQQSPGHKAHQPVTLLPLPLYRSSSCSASPSPNSLPCLLI